MKHYMLLFSQLLFCCWPYAALAQPTYLIVADYYGNAAMQYDLNTGNAAAAFVPSGQGGLNGSSGILSGSDGNFYITSQQNNRVLVKDGENGSFLRKIPTGSSPVGILLSPTGTLLVAEAGPDRISEFNVTTGARIGTWNSGGNLNAPGPMRYGPDGNVYVGSRNNDKVVRFNASTGAFIDNFVSAGSGGLDQPGDLYFHGAYLYVSSRLTNEVLRYDATTGAFVDVFIGTSAGLSSPIGLLRRANGSWLVASLNNNEILAFSSTGALTGTFATGVAASFLEEHAYGPAPENLIENPSGEDDPLTNGWVQLSGNWSRTGSSSSMYGNRGDYFFFAGAGAGTAELYQDVDVSADAPYIDAGNMEYTFEGYMRSYPQSPPDAGHIIVEYLAANGAVLETFDSEQQTNTAYWLKVSDNRIAPVGTRTISIRLQSTRYNGTNNNGHFDNLSLSKNSIGAPFPVRWLTFTAIATDDGVSLNWATTAEINNDYFVIERSVEGSSWQQVGEVPASGKPDGANYEFNDLSPLEGQSFYRIRQVDMDGVFSFSPLRTVQFKQARPTWLVYPNPAKNGISVQGALPVHSVLYLYGPDGHALRVFPYEPNQQLDLTGLSAGNYYLSDGNQTRVVVKTDH